MTRTQLSARVSGPTRSLATVEPGERVRIATILVDSLRKLFNEMGLHEGDTISCRSATPGLLLVEAHGGHTVALTKEHARFVRITDLLARIRSA
jgi:Fe2+ transport system protein FeoA